MSLINDALKRAGQSQKKSGPPPPAGPALPPVIHQLERQTNPASLLLISLLVLVLGAAGWLLWAWAHTPSASVVEKNLPAATAAAQVPAPTPPATMAPPKPAPAPVLAVVPVKPAIKISTNLVVRTNPPATAIETPVAEIAALPAVAGKISVSTPPTATEARPAPVSSTVSPAVPASLETKPAPPPEFPTLKLQGIFYRPGNSSVLISGRTLLPGDQVNEVRVLKIERQSVTLEWNGQTKVLMLE